jgi:phosphate transport system substrate-binding protein
VGELNYSELYEIFHGDAKSWKEFEGGKDQPISLYVIATNTPLGELFNAEVMSGRGVPGDAHILATADLLKAVAGDPQGIGFGPLAAADNLKLVSIKRAPSSTPVIPTAENIGGRIYPISRCVFAYANPAADANGIKQYLDWIRSEAGQQVAREAGFYALSPALLSNQ